MAARLDRDGGPDLTSNISQPITVTTAAAVATTTAAAVATAVTDAQKSGSAGSFSFSFPLNGSPSPRSTPAALSSSAASSSYPASGSLSLASLGSSSSGASALPTPTAASSSLKTIPLTSPDSRVPAPSRSLCSRMTCLNRCNMDSLFIAVGLAAVFLIAMAIFGIKGALVVGSVCTFSLCYRFCVKLNVVPQSSNTSI